MANMSQAVNPIEVPVSLLRNIVIWQQQQQQWNDTSKQEMRPTRGRHSTKCYTIARWR